MRSSGNYSRIAVQLRFQADVSRNFAIFTNVTILTLKEYVVARCYVFHQIGSASVMMCNQNFYRTCAILIKAGKYSPWRAKDYGISSEVFVALGRWRCCLGVDLEMVEPSVDFNLRDETQIHYPCGA